MFSCPFASMYVTIVEMEEQFVLVGLISWQSVFVLLVVKANLKIRVRGGQGLVSFPAS